MSAVKSSVGIKKHQLEAEGHSGHSATTICKGGEFKPASSAKDYFNKPR